MTYKQSFSNHRQFYVSIYRFEVIFLAKNVAKNDIENVNINHREEQLQPKQKLFQTLWSRLHHSKP